MRIFNHTTHSLEETMCTGVYKIYHTYKPDRLYIGSAARAFSKRKYDVGFLVRWKKHLTELTNNCHANTRLQRVVNKYGLAGLRFEIVEYYEPSICIERETFYIDFYKSYYKGYNLRKDGNSQLGVSHKQSTKDKIRKANLNKVVSDYTRDLISQSKKGKRLSKETIRKLKETSPNKKAAYCYTKNGEFFKNFDSIEDCNRYFFPNNYKKGKLWGYIKKNGYLFGKYLIFSTEVTNEDVLKIIRDKKSKTDERIRELNSLRLSKKIPC